MESNINKRTKYNQLKILKNNKFEIMAIIEKITKYLLFI